MFVAPMDAIGWGSHTPASGSYIVNNSALFDGAGDNLSRTPSGAPTSSRTSTMSVWIKRAEITDTTYDGYIFCCSPDEDGIRIDQDNDTLSFPIEGSTYVMSATNRFRDASAWFHLVLRIDTTQSTSTDRIRFYINGSQLTLTGSFPAQNYDFTRWLIASKIQRIGWNGATSKYFSGYMAEFAMYDGQSLGPESFGETNAYGIWSPIEIPSSGFGNNGFHLKFADSSNLGLDSSGNSNTFTVNNLVAANQVEDSPTNDALNNIGNYATFNANIAQSSRNTNTIADGNLHWSGGGGDGIAGTHSFGTSGKWYWEQTAGDADSYVMHGIISKSVYNSNDMAENTGASGFDTIGGDGEAFAWYRGNKWEKTTIVSSYGTATSAADDVVMLALDIDNNKIWYGVNGTWISSGDPAAGSNASSTITSGIEWYPYAGSFTGDPIVNFGQKAFAHTIPTGFSALATQNMTAPAITLPSTYFDVVTYTGTGSELAISSLAFQPDMVWIKNRDQTDNNMLYDVVRGATKEVHTNSNVGETTTAQTLKSFDSAGFTLGTDVEVNTNTEDYVAWCWKAGGSASTVSDGMVKESDSSETSISRSVSTDAGLSIVTYTGNGADSNIKHGLGAKPKFIHICYRAGTTNWLSYHEDANATEGRYFMNLNDTAIAFDNGASGYFQGTAPTTSLFYINNSSYNTSGYTYVAYLWSEIDGFSRFGSYIGNGNADGPHVYLGFEPALLIVKKATSATNNWNMLDHKRHPFNDGDAPYIYADTTAAETNPGDSSQDVDILANGFKIRNSNAGYNTSSATYVYAAWAKTPYALNNRAR